MPSTQTNVKKINKQIAQLDEMDQLSDYNTRHRKFLDLWRQHALTDVVLVIQPKGKINRGDTPPTKLVEVTDMAAARLMAYARQQNLRVRLATPEEAKAYHDYVAQSRIEAQNALTRHHAAVAQQQVAVLTGLATTTFVPPPAPADLARPVVALAPSDDEDDEDEAPLVPTLPGAGSTTVAPPPAPENQTSTTVAPFPLLAQLGDETLVQALVALGVTTVAQVAGSDPAALAEALKAQGVKGIGPARAAGLVTRAAELAAAAANPVTEQAENQTGGAGAGDGAGGPTTET